MGGDCVLNTDKQAVKAIADAIMKAINVSVDQNNKSYVDNSIRNYSGSGNASGSFSGTIPASRISNLYTTVAGYIINAKTASSDGDIIAGKIIGAIGDVADTQITNATFRSAQISDLKAGVANIVHLTTDTAQIQDADIRKLRTDIADVGLANIGQANIGYGQIKDLSTDTAIIREGLSNKLYIDRLAVSEANMVSLTAGEIMLKNSAGNLVRIVVDATTGTVSTETVTFDGDDVLDSNSLSGDRVKNNSLGAGKIVESSITTRELNVSSIFADSAIVRQLIAQNIDTATLFANTGFVNQLYTNTIRAANAGTDIDISRNSQITVLKNRIGLVVEDSSTSSSVVLTPGMIDAVSDQIDVKASTIDLSANTSIDARVQTVIDQNIYYRMDMTSTSDILSDRVTSTTLSVVLYRGNTDITSTASASNFVWKRKSSDTSGDTAWNNSHSGMKSVTITQTDVLYNATFECDYIVDNNVLATASKGIIDTNDGKTLDVSLGTNLPVTQIYDSDMDLYTPNWTINALVITPTVILNGVVIENTDSRLSVIWKRRAIDGTESNLGTGETVNNKVLTVNANTLANVTGGMIAYVAKASYTNADSTVINAEESITYTLMRTAESATAITISIEGEQAFKYAQGSTTPYPTKIKLVANAIGCSVVEWYYKSSNGNWVVYPDNTDTPIAADNELYVHDSDPVFTNDVATIRVETNISGIYDIHSVYKVRDGEDMGIKGDPGENAYAVFLSNENITFAADKDGKIAATTVNCNVVAYNGTTKVTPVVGAVSGAPTGMTITTGSAVNNEIPITITVSANATLGGEGQQFGQLIVPITSPVVTNLNITWSKVNTGATGGKGDKGDPGDTGASGVVLSLYAPNGTVFSNGTGNLTIQASAYSGSTSLNTSTASFTWQQYSSGSWVDISGETGMSIIVSGSSISGTGSFRCTMVYNRVSYYATISLTDKTDNYQAIIESTGGSIIRNNTGSSTLTCRLFQSGKEVDASGSLYTCWWSKIDKNGNAVNWSNGAVRKAGKSINITSSEIDKKTVFVCEVEDQTAPTAERLKATAQYTIVDLDDPIISSTQPSNPEIDTIWVDTSVTPNAMKRWDGTGWVVVSNVDPAAIENRFTTIETSITEQGGQIALKASQESVNSLGGRVTSTETQVANLTTQYNGIALVVAKKSSNYRQEATPTDANAGDIWVIPSTGKEYQAVLNEDTIQWVEVVSQEFAQLVVKVNGIDSTVSDLSGDVSQISQKADKIDWIIASGTSASNMSLTQNAYTLIANNIDLSANNTVRITSAGQISASAASGIDLSSNDTVRIISSNQISAAAVNGINLATNNSLNIITGGLQSNISSTQSALDDLNIDYRETKSTIDKWFSFTDDGLIISQPEYTDESGVDHPSSIWSTVTDNIGYHIKRKDMEEYVGSFYRDRLKIQNLEIGKTIMRASSKGGIVWTGA